MRDKGKKRKTGVESFENTNSLEPQPASSGDDITSVESGGTDASNSSHSSSDLNPESSSDSSSDPESSSSSH